MSWVNFNAEDATRFFAECTRHYTLATNQFSRTSWATPLHAVLSSRRLIAFRKANYFWYLHKRMVYEVETVLIVTASKVTFRRLQGALFIEKHWSISIKHSGLLTNLVEIKTIHEISFTVDETPLVTANIFLQLRDLKLSHDFIRKQIRAGASSSVTTFDHLSSVESATRLYFEENAIHVASIFTSASVHFLCHSFWDIL